MNERDLFAAANAISDPVERSAFLDRECVGRPELRGRLELLINVPTDLDVLIDQLAAKPVSTLTIESIQHQSTIPSQSRLLVGAGTVVAGRYKLGGRLGDGGESELWWADQAGPDARRVVLRFSPVESRRANQFSQQFEPERLKAMTLDHPNLAKILDGGVLGDGTVYIVSEFVNGAPLIRFCERARIDIRERLGLFVQVCHAVQHMHADGIILGELKPSNILVKLLDEEPSVRLVDVGLTDAPMNDPAAEHASVDDAAFAKALRYMAPEQASLDATDLDARTDVYLLGIILYELLTSSTPIESAEINKTSPSDRFRLIRESSPPTPSQRLNVSKRVNEIAANRRTNARKLARLIAGGLDRITMKALASDRDQRYQTARDLARDAELYLRDEPILAGPSDFGDELQRLVRRSRIRVGVGPFMVVVATLGVALSMNWLIQSERRKSIAEVEASHAVEISASRETARVDRANAEFEKKERFRAEAERRKAVRRRDFDALRTASGSVVSKLIGNCNDLTPNEHALVESLIDRWKELVKGSENDVESRRLRANGRLQIASLLQGQGRLVEAIVELRAACELLEEIAASRSSAAIDRAGFGDALVRLSSLLARIGRKEESLVTCQSAIGRFRTMVKEFPHDPVYAGRLVAALSEKGKLSADLDKREEAMAALREAIDLQRKLTASDRDQPELEQNLAQLQGTIGLALHRFGRREEAIREYRKSLELRKKLVSIRPEIPDHHERLAKSHVNLAALYSDSGKTTEALEELRFAVAIRRELCAKHPRVAEYRRALGDAQSSIGDLLVRLERTREALEEHLAALVISKQLAVEFPSDDSLQQKLSGDHLTVGNLLARLKDATSAMEHHRAACSVLQSLVDRNPGRSEFDRDLGRARSELLTLLRRYGKGDEARSEYLAARKVQEQLIEQFPDDAEHCVDFAVTQFNYGSLLLDEGRAADSIDAFNRSVGLLEPQVERNPDLPLARECLRESIWGRAQANALLQNGARAMRDVDRVIALAPENERRAIIAARANLRLKAGDVAGALADADELTRDGNWGADQWYNFACLYSVASARLPGKRSNYVDRAMDILQKAIQTGYSDFDKIKDDPDLDPIRGREDFVKWLTDLEGADKKTRPVSKQ